jgi:hypothetical protein
MRQYMRTRQNQFADKLLASKGYIPVLIQLGMEECARIFNNSKHNKPSQGSEYSCGTVVGFLRKMDASVRAYQARPTLGTYYTGDILLGTYYCREVYRRAHHGCATAAVIKNVLMIMILKWAPRVSGASTRIRHCAPKGINYGPKP